MPDIFDSTNSNPTNASLSQTTAPVTDKITQVKEKIIHKFGLSDRNVSHRHIDDYSEVMRKALPDSNPLSSFSPKPLKTGFSTQAIGENVILLLRQHPVTQVWWVFLAVVLAFAPVFFDSISFFVYLPVRFQLAVYFGWYLGMLGFIFESFIKWFYNVYIVTDERIIDIDFYSLTYRNISAAKIDNIEDTTASTSGFLSAMFDYGTVTIQTAAEKREFEFQGVPHPTRVTTLINDLILEEEREKIDGRVN